MVEVVRSPGLAHKFGQNMRLGLQEVDHNKTVVGPKLMIMVKISDFPAKLKILPQEDRNSF